MDFRRDLAPNDENGVSLGSPLEIIISFSPLREDVEPKVYQAIGPFPEDEVHDQDYLCKLVTGLLHQLSIEYGEESYSFHSVIYRNGLRTKIAITLRNYIEYILRMNPEIRRDFEIQIAKQALDLEDYSPHDEGADSNDPLLAYRANNLLP